jgi:UDP-N-acetylglucosamine 3-dehydrogenase
LRAAEVSVRFAVVGCGTAARHIHLPALRAAGVDVTVFASRSRASAEARRDEWGSGAVAERWEDAVARDDVDAVVIAVPNAFHRDVAVAAATAGKHVLVDKPIATTTEDADEMIAAAKAHRVVLVPFQNTRFAAPFVAAQQFVAAGNLGEVTGFRAAFGHAGPQAWAPQAEWFFDRSLAGGGCLIDLGVHVVDLVRCVTGDDIVAVAALVNGRRGDVEADAQLLARLRGGAIGTIHASWSSPSGSDQQLTVIGTKGTLHLDNRTPLTFIDSQGDRERLALPETTSSPLAELLAAIAGERLPSVTAADGRAAVAVVQAAYYSAAHGSQLTDVV